MNKTKLSKIIIFIITFALIVCITTNVFADEPKLEWVDGTEDDVESFDGQIDGNTNADPIENLTPSENNTTTGENTNTNTNSNNTSTYEKTDIPYAGPVEDALMVVAFIIFGIIGIYTFKKLSDYSNL